VVVIAVLVVGVVKLFAGPMSSHRACEKISDLCGVSMSSSDLDECASDIKELPDSVSGKVTECVVEATSCADAVGCAMGVAHTAIEKELHKLDNGFERGRRK
jgi:hypothetical protein